MKKQLAIIMVLLMTIFIGFGIIGQTANGFPASDPIWDPFYKTSIDAQIPVLIHCGLTGIGQ